VIEAIPDMPAGTLGFRISGELHRSDYTGTLEPALKGVVDAGGRLRTLYLVESLGGMSPGALWEDVKTGSSLGIGHLSAWERTAIVTDIDWVVQTSKLFAWMIPGEFAVHGTSELEAAKGWVAAGAA